MLAGGASVPQVVIDSLEGQKLWMASTLWHSTSFQNKYPEQIESLHYGPHPSHCQIWPVWLHDGGEPVSNRDGGSTLLGHLQRFLHHLPLAIFL